MNQDNLTHEMLFDDEYGMKIICCTLFVLENILVCFASMDSEQTRPMSRHGTKQYGYLKF